MGKIPHTLLLTVALILDSVSRTFAAYATLLGSHLQIHVRREIRNFCSDFKLNFPKVLTPCRLLHILTSLPNQLDFASWSKSSGVNSCFFYLPSILVYSGLIPSIQETHVQSLGWEDPLEEEMATHSSILVWRIPRTEEPGGLQSSCNEWGTTE